MDIDKLREAALFLIGKHDFRNFCKIDILSTVNYIRTIISLDIEEV